MTRTRIVLLPLALALIAATALAALPQQPGSVDLLTQSNGSVKGATAGDVFGESLAFAGDVNGDGIGDVLVGSGTRNAAVIFGGEPFGDLDSASPGSRGFRITGNHPIQSEAAAGDVNGDGKADVLIGDST